MTTQKRGSEKLLDNEDGLCELTAEELLQVGGMGPQPPFRWNYGFDLKPIDFDFDYCPYGICAPDLFLPPLDRIINTGRSFR